ncbi:MAG: hypothetical protein LC746_11115 [Acidobacteria bacterium]|nr:hypothetical protein [Acidobacteriota bacterium]
MKKLTRQALLVGAAIWLAAGGVVSAQQPGSGINELKRQIQVLVRAESDPATPDDLRERNRGYLQERREKLYSLLKKRQTALQRYQASVGSALSADENRVIEAELQQIDESLRGLEGEVQTAKPAGDVAAASAATPVEVVSTKPAVAIPAAFESLPMLDALAAGRTRRAAVVPAAAQRVTCPITISDPDPSMYSVDRNPFRLRNLANFGVKVTITPPAGSTLDDCDLKKFLIITMNTSLNGSSKGTSRTLSSEQPWKDRLAEQELDVKFGEGDNAVVVKDADDNNNSSRVLYIRCTGDNCGKGSGGDEKKSSPLTAFSRGIVGVDRTGASSADAEQKFLLEFNLRAPLAYIGNRQDHFSLDDDINSRVWAWFNPRITSLAQQAGVAASDLTSAGSFFSPITGGKIADISQALEFLGGFEIALLKPRHMRAIPSGFEKTHARFGLSFVLGGGVITPFSTQKTQQIFKVNSTITDRFPDAKGKDFIAFVSQDRSRFFRQYYGGLRLSTFYYDVKDNGDEKAANRFPGTFDLTFGQNEAVTGGCLCGGVMRLEGFYPLPYAPSFYVFGTSLTKLSKAKVSNSLILQPPDSGTVVSITSDKVFIQPITPSDRDMYRLGVGVDLIQLFKKKEDTKKQ